MTDEPGGDPRWPRPGEVVPMTATVAERRGAAPGRDLGEGWSFERKLDGYRCLAWVDGPSGGDGVALRQHGAAEGMGGAGPMVPLPGR